MALAASVARRVEEKLKRHRPAHVIVYRADADEPTTITPTGERGRWQRVLQSIHPSAERLEFCDKQKQVIVAMDLVSPDAKPANDEGKEDRLLALMLRAQEVVLERQNAAMKGITDAYASLAKLLAERLTSLEKSYSEVLKGAYEATLMAAEAQARMDTADEGGGVEALVKQVAGRLVGDGRVDTNSAPREHAGPKGGAQ